MTKWIFIPVLFGLSILILLLLPQSYSRAQAMCLSSQGHLLWSGSQAAGDIPVRDYNVANRDTLLQSGLKWLGSILSVPGDVKATGDVGGKRLCIGADCRDKWSTRDPLSPSEMTIPFELYDKPKAQGGKVIFRIRYQ